MNPLVLVHGFLGGSAQWAPVRRDLGDRLDLHAVDLPGFGANARTTAPDRIRDFAAFTLDWAAERGLDRFDLLGHSMGGMIAQEMVALAPDRIARLILYGTGPRGLLPGRFESIADSKRRANEEGASATARRIAATWFLEGEKDEAYADCAAIAEAASIEAICAGLDAMECWSGVHNLSAISSPTLIIWGDRDKSYPWSQVESLWTGISGAGLAVVPGCAHAVHLEKPHLFNPLLSDFLV